MQQLPRSESARSDHLLVRKLENNRWIQSDKEYHNTFIKTCNSWRKQENAQILRTLVTIPLTSKLGKIISV